VSNQRDADSSSPDEDSPESAESVLPESQNALSVITTRRETPASPIESPLSVTPMIISPSEPYIRNERYFAKYFIELTSAIVGRSKTAPHFWQTLVPRAAWSFPSVRHAMIAAAMSCETLLNRENALVPRQQSDLQVLNHASRAVQALLAGNVPLDVVLLTSATLGILDLFKGEWDTACTHVVSGAKLAKQAQTDRDNDPYISFYCEAFASALPGVLSRVQKGGNQCPAEKNSIVRLNEAVQSLRLANTSFDQAWPKIERHQGTDRDRIANVVRNAKRETEWILHRWESLLLEERERTSPPDDDLQIQLHRVESPWSAVMGLLNAYFDEGGPWNIAKFEVAMERTLPFYLLAKSGPNIKMRETAVELMYMGTRLRGKSVTALQSLPGSRRVSEDKSEGG